MKKSLVAFMLIFASLLFCFVAEAEMSAGSQAPEISAQNWINGKGIKLAENQDKTVVIEFWATWCPPCRKSIPHLKQLNNEYKNKNVIFVSLTNEDLASVEKFNQKVGMDWLIGTGSNTASDYKVNGIPHAFIIQKGKVVWEGHPMFGLEEKLKEITK